MEAVVIGVERVTFTPKGSTEPICGAWIFLANEISAESGLGSRVERQFLSETKQLRLGVNPDALIGKTVRAHFNRYGKIYGLEIVEN